jgi:hypothetical protein
MEGNRGLPTMCSNFLLIITSYPSILSNAMKSCRWYMVNVHLSSVVDRGFEPQFGQTIKGEICITIKIN